MEIEISEQVISQGAEAKVYLSSFHGKQCIVKERFSKSYRVKELDDKLTKQRILNEVRNLTKLNRIGVNTPYVIFVDLTGKRIYLQYIEHSTMMKNVLRSVYSTENSQQYENLINKMIENLAYNLAQIHNNNVIHGDLTTSNLMLVLSESDNVEYDILKKQSFTSIYFIDFGLSYVSSQNEDKAVDLYVLKRAIISSNPKSEEIFDKMLAKYKKYANNGEQIVNLLIKVEQRGRKKIAFG